ncbi:tripartite tricarboxylate transporter substrate binding protein [Bordetella sp. 15P40C-2]|uniref:Bug family tripartite tricarboxylate transporter substrate binding protein n=1 Tax=Bordetella sp. 15P40C-2 TaxID=2572246 RepID=UPI0013257159|nr:tripartite tricarboxylate transporter substrate binding protein [Bordetella sp. 15P40C-2]MVW70689.1 tripartite tricarboxylate transporter substrate binding protein [Bordetella sp. 15P40C-2]
MIKQLSVVRRRLLQAVVAAPMTCLALPGVAANAYPSKPITMVVGFPPGGSNDIVARIIAPKLGELLGTSVIVENKPGANATIGTEYVARAKPDGYTITLGSVSPLLLSYYAYPNLPYDPYTDLSGITTVAATPELIAINPNVPAKSLAELVALSKKQDVTLASAGNGGLPHLAIELLKAQSQGRIVHVPYKGASPGMVDAVGGHVNGIIMDLPALHKLVTEGRLRPIVVTDTKRSPAMSEVPTTVEAGLPSVIAFNWFAVMGPKGLPMEIREKLHDALVKTVNDPSTKEKLEKLGIGPFTQASPAAFDTFMKEEGQRWSKLIKDAGVKTDD